MSKITIIKEYPYNQFVERAARVVAKGGKYRFERKRVLYDLRAGWKGLIFDIRREANHLVFDIEEGHLYVVNVIVEVDEYGWATLSGLPDLVEL